MLRVQFISIHAPAKGATSQVFSMIFLTLYFNPRSREGSDVDILRGLCYDGISIHAPAKGATSLEEAGYNNYWISIHAPAKGATRAADGSFVDICNFNPRSREGSDSISCLTTFTNRHFNPRSREGSDCIRARYYKDGSISIHAPAKGATITYRDRERSNA